MAYNKSTGSDSFQAVKEALVHGTKVAAADEAGELMLIAARAMLGDAYPTLLSTEDGQEVAKGIAAAALIYAVDAMPGTLPHEEGLRRASTMVLEAVARDLVQPRLKALEPVLTQLAQAGGRALSVTSDKASPKTKA